MTVRTLPPGGILGELGNAAARQQGALGGGLSRLDTGAGVQAGSEPRDSIWIRITGPPAADDRLAGLSAAMYPWEFVYRRDRDLFDLALQKSGSESGYPAFEMNDFANVPGGSIVRAWFGANDDTIGLEFVYDQGECCDTGGGGGGGGTDCCGYWFYNTLPPGPGQPPSNTWVWYLWGPTGNGGGQLPGCSQVLGWVFCFDGTYHWVPPGNCRPPNVPITNFSPIVPCGTPPPAAPPVVGGTSGTGGGVACQGCNPAVDNPCYNCQNGLFCSNPEACFNKSGGAPSAPAAPLFGGGFGSRFGSTPVGDSCHCGGTCSSCSGSAAQSVIDPMANALVAALSQTMQAFGAAWGGNLGNYPAPFVTAEQLGLPTLTDDDVVIGSSAGTLTNLTLTAGQVPQHSGGAVIGVRKTVIAGRVLAIGAVVPPVHAAITDTDDMVCIQNGSGNAVTVDLPASPTAWHPITIKDDSGNAAANNFTLTPAAGNIDGAGTSVMNVNYQSRTVIYNGTQWNVMSAS